MAKKFKHVQRKRLALRRWHGPAVILAIEGNTKSILMAGYVAYGGNVTKVAMEHLRHASALERLVAEDWGAIVEDVINSVNPNEGGVPSLQDGQAEEDQQQAEQPQVPEPALPMLPEHQPVVPNKWFFPTHILQAWCYERSTSFNVMVLSSQFETTLFQTSDISTCSSSSS